MLGPIRSAGNATELALIIAGSRRTHSLDHIAIDGQCNGRNPGLFNPARQQPHRLMAEFRSGNLKRSLHLIMLHPIDELRHSRLNKARGVRDESAETPEGGIKLADNSVRLKLDQTRERNLRVYVLADESLVIATTSKLQITRINLGWDFAKGDVA